MNKKTLRISALIITFAMLITGVALVICGGIYLNNKNIKFLMFLERAGADSRYVEEVLDCVEENIDTWQGVLSGEKLPSDKTFCDDVVKLAQIFSRLDSKSLANAAYEFINNEASFADVGVLGRYSSLLKRKDLLAKLKESLGEDADVDFAELLNKCKTLSLSHLQVISAQLVTLCDYVSVGGSDLLSSTVDVVIRTAKYRDSILEHVSLREMLSSAKYMCKGLAECDSIDVTFDVLNKLYDKKLLDILSQTPQLISAGLNFVNGVDVDVIADIVSYTFYPNISVALLHSLNEQEIVNKDNVHILAQEIASILIQFNIADMDFENFFYTVNQKDDNGEYLFNPQNLSQEQEVYVYNNIQPIKDVIWNVKVNK